MLLGMEAGNVRDGPLENLWGGGWGAKSKKIYIYSRRGKLNEKKNACTPFNPKKYSCYDLKKIIQGIR